MGPSKGMLEDWQNGLEYDRFDNEDAKGARGFKFKVDGPLVFAALYEFLNINDVVPKISDLKYQMKFTWSEKLEKLPTIENCPEIEGLKGDSEEENGEVEDVST
jgi:hypothetical protein